MKWLGSLQPYLFQVDKGFADFIGTLMNTFFYTGREISSKRHLQPILSNFYWLKNSPFSPTTRQGPLEALLQPSDCLRASGLRL